MKRVCRHTLVELERPHSLVTYVFNAEQIEGMPAFVPDAEHIPDVERAEKLLAASVAGSGTDEPVHTTGRIRT